MSPKADDTPADDWSLLKVDRDMSRKVNKLPRTSTNSRVRSILIWNQMGALAAINQNFESSGVYSLVGVGIFVKQIGRSWGCALVARRVLCFISGPYITSVALPHTCS